MRVVLDKVLCKEIKSDVEVQTKSGLFIPDTAANGGTKRAEVIEVGEGKSEEPMSIQKGDIIVYLPNYAAKFIEDEVEYFVIKQSDIIAVL